MKASFTQYVRDLDPTGEPPDKQTFDTLLESLRSALIGEMKRRSAWSLPPRYLGILGDNHWSRSPLDELLLECYEFTFFFRLKGLRRQLNLKPSIDGFVYRNIRNFLHDKQRQWDPLGTRIYELLQRAVSLLRDEGTLYVLDGDLRLRGDTVLGWDPHADGRDAEGVDFSEIVPPWHDSLPLLTAWNRDEAANALAEKIRTLPQYRITVFRFRDLLGALRDEARRRWSTIRLGPDAEVVRDGDEFVLTLDLLRPDRKLMEEARLKALVDCITGGIDRLDERERTKDYLRRLLLYLRDWASEEGPIDRRPSDLQLSKLLSIPRDRLPGFHAILSKLARSCHKESISGSSSSDSESSAPSGDIISARTVDGSLMHQDQQQRLEALRRRAARPTEEAVDGEATSSDVFLFPETADHPVEWAVLERDPEDSGRVLVVPLDDHPLVGSRDVALGDGVRALRCARGAWIDSSACRDDLRGGAVAAADLAEARRLRRELLSGEAQASTARREVDLDPEYRLWLDELDAARSSLPGGVKRDAEEGSEAPVREPAPVVDLKSRAAKSRRNQLVQWGGWLAAAAALLWIAPLQTANTDLLSEIDQARKTIENTRKPYVRSYEGLDQLRPTTRSLELRVVDLDDRFLQLEIVKSFADPFPEWALGTEYSDGTIYLEPLEYAQRWIFTVPNYGDIEGLTIRLYGFEGTLPNEPLRAWILEDGIFRRLEPDR